MASKINGAASSFFRGYMLRCGHCSLILRFSLYLYARCRNLTSGGEYCYKKGPREEGLFIKEATVTKPDPRHRQVSQSGVRYVRSGL